MRGLLELITKNIEANSIIPILAIISIIVTVVVYVVIKQKWIRYVSATVIIIVGLVMFYLGYKSMLDVAGLNLIATSAKVLVFGIIMFLFLILLDTLESLSESFPKLKKTKKVKTETKTK